MGLYAIAFFRMTCVSRPFQHPTYLYDRQISLNLEPPLWLAFRQLATERRLSNKGLLEQIYAEAGHYGPHPSITSLVRSYLVADLIRRVR
jgi:predicted DNA-binding ribbon-helix-helix protein